MKNEKRDPFTQAMYAECDRAIAAYVAILEKWPERRKELASEMLGSVVGFCDTMGVDPIKVIAGIRAEAPLPAVLVPPNRDRS